MVSAGKIKLRVVKENRTNRGKSFILICNNCKAMFKRYGKEMKAKYSGYFCGRCSKMCMAKFHFNGFQFRNKLGERKFKGGYIDTLGYRNLGRNNKKIREHRFVLEKLLGRKLKREEVVHHKDHNKLNNSIENLQILTNREHMILHCKERKLKK